MAVLVPILLAWTAIQLSLSDRVVLVSDSRLLTLSRVSLTRFA